MTYPRDLPVLASATPVSLSQSDMNVAGGSPGMSMMQLALILWAYRKLSLLIFVAIAGSAALACSLWPRTYESTATLMVNFEVNDPLAGKEFPVGLLGSYMATQVELARGSEVLLTVIDQLRLGERKDLAAGYKGPSSGLRNWIETRVRKHLVIDQGHSGSQLITVTYSARSAMEAAQVANAVADAYSEQQYRMLAGPATERARRYTAELDGLKGKVEAAQQQMSRFRQANGLTGGDSRNDVDMHATLIQSLKAQLATMESHFAELRPTLGERHPQILELQSQINSTRKTLSDELRAYSGKAAAELEGSKYQLELQSAQASYARALDGYDQVMLASTGGYSNVSFINRAAPSSKPSKPNVIVAMIGACVIGLGLGIGLPLFYEMITRRVRCRDDMERDHGIPVLAELSAVNVRGEFLQGSTA